MKPFSRETLGYASLLVILFAIAALAVWQALSFLGDHVTGDAFRIAAAVLWSITLGFMLISGAFGLWAIQFAAQAEGRRRVARFVDAMEYLQDGLLSIDHKSRITGANPAARALAGVDAIKGRELTEVFPCLSANDADSLVTALEPHEVEYRILHGEKEQTLRFRSQPSEGLTLILLSDVTAMQALRQYNRQVARLQLIGQIARGVAHDFNNLLCAISGHASLLTRLTPNSPDVGASIRAILQGVERGSALANHLMQLSRTEGINEGGRSVADSVQIACQNLRNSLPPEWSVEPAVSDLLPTSLSPIQVEQVVLNLGLLVADVVAQPGSLRVLAGRSPSSPLLTVGNRHAGAIVVGAGATLDAADAAFRFAEIREEAGVIVSVVKSVIEGSGGLLERAVGNGGMPVYRIALPFGTRTAGAAGQSSLLKEIGPYFANWSIVLARPPTRRDALTDLFRQLSTHLKRVDSVVAMLSCLQEQPAPDAVLVDHLLLGNEPDAVLRAMLRLSPLTAFVVLSANEEPIKTLASDVILVAQDANNDRILMAIVEAKSLAARRKAS